MSIKITGDYISTPELIDVRQYDTLSEAINSIGNNEVTLLISSPFTVGEDVTIPENICLKFTKGGKLVINDGCTVTINGAIEAGLWQIFDGNGTVTGNPKIEAVYPEWFGADPTGGLGSSSAIAKAINFFSNIKLFPFGNYYIDSEIVIDKRIVFDGQSSVLRIAPDIYAFKIGTTNFSTLGSIFKRLQFTAYSDTNRARGAFLLDMTNGFQGQWKFEDIFISGGGNKLIDYGIDGVNLNPSNYAIGWLFLERVRIRECNIWGVCLPNVNVLSFTECEFRNNGSNTGSFVDDISSPSSGNVKIGRVIDLFLDADLEGSDYGLVAADVRGGILNVYCEKNWASGVWIEKCDGLSIYGFFQYSDLFIKEIFDLETKIDFDVGNFYTETVKGKLISGELDPVFIDNCNKSFQKKYEIYIYPREFNLNPPHSGSYSHIRNTVSKFSSHSGINKIDDKESPTDISYVFGSDTDYIEIPIGNVTAGEYLKISLINRNSMLYKIYKDGSEILSIDNDDRGGWKTVNILVDTTDLGSGLYAFRMYRRPGVPGVKFVAATVIVSYSKYPFPNLGVCLTDTSNDDLEGRVKIQLPEYGLLGSLGYISFNEDLADEGIKEFPFADGCSGFGFVTVGDNVERALFFFSSTTESITLIDSSANITNSDTDNYFCVYRRANNRLAFKNRLGSTYRVKSLIFLGKQ